MKGKSLWEQSILELIRRTSVDLPADVELALRRARDRAKRDRPGRWALDAILANVAAARANDAPLCQDTGTLTFFCCVPVGFDTNALTAVVRSAVTKSTRAGYLRMNTVNPVSGESHPTNVAHGAPVIHYEQGARETVDVRLLMKGGGCENVGHQYSLPDEEFGADRDLEGVRRCILHAVWRAQGRGCAPGVLGVCVGGDRSTGFRCSKEQFLRKLDDRAKIRRLARLERRVLRESRELQIGPMGLGGTDTILGVKIGVVSRLPASFFVTVSYMCWAMRRRGVLLRPGGGVRRWLY